MISKAPKIVPTGYQTLEFIVFSLKHAYFVVVPVSQHINICSQNNSNVENRAIISIPLNKFLNLDVTLLKLMLTEYLVWLLTQV